MPGDEVSSTQKVVAMPDKTIFITEYDMKRLRELLMVAARRPLDRENLYLKSLEAELDRGKLVTSEDVPSDVITMNSCARLVDLDTGEEMTYTLVFPQAADTSQGKISVLAPVGTAMLGCRVGDVFTWEVPAGVRKLKVDGVLYQPEAAGDNHL
jgi:regulator of nucleoside diphosphate kinase